MITVHLFLLSDSFFCHFVSVLRPLEENAPIHPTAWVKITVCFLFLFTHSPHSDSE